MRSLPKECLCPKCGTAYLSPFVLPCGHSICKNCYEENDCEGICGEQSCQRRFHKEDRVVENKTLNGLVQCILSLQREESRSGSAHSLSFGCAHCKDDVGITLKITVKDKRREEKKEEKSTPPTAPIEQRREKESTPPTAPVEEEFVQPSANPFLDEPEGALFPTPPPSPPRPTEFANDQKIRRKELTDIPGISQKDVMQFEAKRIRNAKMLLGYYLDIMDQDREKCAGVL
ncbi:hypothetical protein QR680_004811 [Steinernema hermaphroditum]|uniref:RING-type domain-containing protein n=1 Tax=Steinernema hermaphroditum TaxID=289476 RepID=A0AA39HQZ8_9BILA|nr:hypothetical protein QR680_004811 [Steinernema hermaphroditum]